MKLSTHTLFVLACVTVPSVSGCLEPKSVKCSFGVVCPAGTRCDEQTQGCIYPEQQQACSGKPQGAVCEMEGVGGAHVCVDGICRLSRCGDSVVDDRPEVGEVCDDGNNEPGDGCRADCLGVEVCGDGLSDPAALEECDGGDIPATCEELDPNSTGGQPDCTDSCAVDPSTCWVCGDGTLDPGEECDDGTGLSDVTPDACRTDCVEPACEDGVIDSGERGGCWRFGSSYPAPGSAYRVAMGDLNGDGRMDVVAIGDSPRMVSAYLSDGQGGLSPAPGSPHGLSNSVYDIILADFDRNGDLDVAVVVGSTGVDVFLGDGNGNLAAVSNPMPVSGVQLDSGTRGYFDGDQYPDLAFTNRNACDLRVALGRGDGTFDPPVAVDVGLSWCDSVAVEAAELNGDDATDLVAVSEDGSVIAQGDGQGGFSHVAAFPLDIVEGLVRDMEVGDVDGDGRLDLVYAVQSLPQSFVHVIRNLGNFTFEPAPGNPFPAGAMAFAVSACDLDGDGRSDAVVADHIASEFHVLMGAGDGGLVRADHSPVPANGYARDAAVGDVDGDGYLDAVMLDPYDDTMRLFWSRP
jgi:cysteine-rich repeat protein